MTTIRIRLNEDQSSALQTLALQTGKGMEELIHEAIAHLTVGHFRTDEQASVKIARGIWKDRDDLDKS